MKAAALLPGIAADAVAATLCVVLSVLSLAALLLSVTSVPTLSIVLEAAVDGVTVTAAVKAFRCIRSVRRLIRSAMAEEAIAERRATTLPREVRGSAFALHCTYVRSSKGSSMERRGVQQH